MTEVLAPPVGEVLTVETVGLLRAGDVLRCVKGSEEAPAIATGEIVSFVRHSGSGGISKCIVTSADESFGYRPGRFTFLSRPSLPAPTVQVEGQDSGLLPPQEACVPAMNKSGDADFRRAAELAVDVLTRVRWVREFYTDGWFVSTVTKDQIAPAVAALQSALTAAPPSTRGTSNASKPNPQTHEAERRIALEAGERVPLDALTIRALLTSKTGD